MLTQGEDVEVQALASRGWSVSAIARHLDRDRKTVRAYVRGERQAGVRARTAPDPLAPFAAYLAARFADDPHVWATALFDEVVPLGYGLSYVSFARQLRLAGLRPHCEPCAGVSGRDTIEIDHPAGEEMQWDWFERRKAPWGGTAYVLLGTLPHSGRVRGVLAESLDQPHLIEAIDAVLRRHGGTPRIWRTDRLATVIVPGSRDVQPSFAPVAKFYGVVVEPCPPRRGNRKGAAGSSVRYVCGRWWRTMTAVTPAQAQASLDVFCSGTADTRRRKAGGIASTVGALADAEPMLALPAAPYPATVIVSRQVGPNAAVAFRGNSCSVPPGWPAPRSNAGTVSAPPCWRSARRAGSRWRRTGWPRTAPAPWSAPPGTAPSWNGPSCRRSPRTGRASARATTRPAPQPATKPHCCSPAWART
jgi:transposase